MLYNKAIIDHTSPALCTPSPPSRPIPFAANVAATEWSLLLHDIIGDWIIPFTANTLQCIVNVEENPKLPLPLGILSPCRKMTQPRPQTTCTRNLVKIVCGSEDMLADRQTPHSRQTDTQTWSSQYFMTTPAGKVNMLKIPLASITENSWHTTDCATEWNLIHYSVKQKGHACLCQSWLE